MIDINASWYNMLFLENEEEYKGVKLNLQGQEKVYNFLIENPKAYAILESKVKEMLS